MASMEITAGLQALLNLAYPGLPPRQQASKARNDLIRLYGDRLSAAIPPVIDSPGIDSPIGIGVLHPLETAKDFTIHIAHNAPAIDTTNWALILRNVQESISVDRWGNDDQMRLLGELNMPFENAMNEKRVQNSRIKAFFTQHLS